MTLRLTPDMLAAAYDFLRSTDPFKAWKLPESDDIGFSVIRDKDRYGDFCVMAGVPTIRISETCIGHTASLLAKMGHECIHLRQYLTGDTETHGPRFQKAAARICKIHGFDPKTF